MEVEYVKPSVELLTSRSEISNFPARIEQAGRTCYRSEDRMGADTAESFCRMLIRRGHESVLEHCQFSVRLTCDRATSHQVVRHRLCAFSQESQRYVAYREKLSVIDPGFKDETILDNWQKFMEVTAMIYKQALDSGEKPEVARAVLPNCVATHLVMSANVRQWRHIFVERAINKRSQAQFRGLMGSLLTYLNDITPCLFGDLYERLTT